ncbi:hypothetical protein L873DRAFT_1701410 [Choiromyces venosus 120613-1]|uniref:Uncharacterized protein n=1 Tax=Choiromyces venosus 120613-1 TaxID=1336337 RepID=A0A3N4JAS6_9PEZI|nr:hypothetical protein L873DRAFT_1701410 [Choiromyces venosus 120613-1]
MPTFNQGARIIQMFQQLLNGQQKRRDQFGLIQDEFIQIQDQTTTFPRMLYNADASHLEPPRYPAGIPINNLPATRRELETFTGPQLQVAVQVLELSVLRELFDSLSTM